MAEDSAAGELDVRVEEDGDGVDDDVASGSEASSDSSDDCDDDMTMTNNTSLYLDPTPSLTFPSNQSPLVFALVGLKDGLSFVSCSADRLSKHWTISEDCQTFRLVGTFVGGRDTMSCGVEKWETKSFITGSEKSLKEWSTTTHQCLNSVRTKDMVLSLMMTKNQKTLVCGLQGGVVEVREAGDLGLISSFKLHSGAVYCICELEDGSFASGFEAVKSDDDSDGSHEYPFNNTLKRWNQKGEVLLVFAKFSSSVLQLIELQRDVIVSADGDGGLMMWNATNGDCLRSMFLHLNGLYGLIKLSEDTFITGSFDNTIRVWDDRGDCLNVIKTDVDFCQMTRVGNAIVTTTRGMFEIRRLK